ncbi:MAG: glycosyltransferase family 39 protein [Bacteroidales bacterium]|nr:glycosyltransferase family 39 protein [Bacteroidales bacterium]
MKQAKYKNKNLTDNAPNISMDINQNMKWWKMSKIPYFLLMVLVFILYSNTLTLDYALDDRMIITENQFTKKGIAGIPEIMTNDAFTGFFGTKKSLVAGGRYRPLTQIMFAFEYHFFGLNPVVSHLINLLLYILLCVLLYALLRELFTFEKDKVWYCSLAFWSALIFSLHPVHTEVVANIKGRDEIASLLGAVAAFWFAIKYLKTEKIIHLLWMMLVFMVGVFSKENALTFVAVIPLSIFFFFKPNFKKHLTIATPLIVVSGIFLFFRQMAIGDLMNQEIPPEILNNPFLNVDYSTELATVLYTWWKYLTIMLFPHPLTHDYYPFQIAYYSLSNVFILLFLLSLIVLAFFSVCKFFKNSLWAWALMIVAATFSIQSNLFFNIGTFMNERFLFAPSIGLSILIALPFVYFLKNEKYKKTVFSVLIVIMTGYSAKTFSRNFAWKNDQTLFRTDVKVSSNSIKCNVSAGGVTVEMAKEAKTEVEKQQLLTEALGYLSKAQKLHPQSFYAWFLAANAYSEMGDWSNAFSHMKNALIINFQSAEAQNNMHYIAQKSYLAQNYSVSADAYSSLAKLDEGNETYFISLANSLSYIDQADSSLRILQRVIDKNPQSAAAYGRMGEIYGRIYNNLGKAEYYLLKSLSLDNEDLAANENMGIVLGMQGRFQESLQYLYKAVNIDSTQSRIYLNISGTYKYMGDQTKSDEYAAKANALTK